MTAKSVNTVEAKNRLNELISHVNRTKEPLIVEKRGSPVAVVLDYETYKGSQKNVKSEADTVLIKELYAFHQQLKVKYPKGTGDSVEILSQLRSERGP